MPLFLITLCGVITALQNLIVALVMCSRRIFLSVSRENTFTKRLWREKIVGNTWLLRYVYGFFSGHFQFDILKPCNFAKNNERSTFGCNFTLSHLFYAGVKNGQKHSTAKTFVSHIGVQSLRNKTASLRSDSNPENASSKMETGKPQFLISFFSQRRKNEITLTFSLLNCRLTSDVRVAV